MTRFMLLASETTTSCKLDSWSSESPWWNQHQNSTLPRVSLDWQLMNSVCLGGAMLFRRACRDLGTVSSLEPAPASGWFVVFCWLALASFPRFTRLPALPSQWVWQARYRTWMKIHFSGDELATHWSTVLSNTRSSSGVSWERTIKNQQLRIISENAVVPGASYLVGIDAIDLFELFHRPLRSSGEEGGASKLLHLGNEQLLGGGVGHFEKRKHQKILWNWTKQKCECWSCGWITWTAGYHDLCIKMETAHMWHVQLDLSSIFRTRWFSFGVKGVLEPILGNVGFSQNKLPVCCRDTHSHL